MYPLCSCPALVVILHSLFFWLVDSFLHVLLLFPSSCLSNTISFCSQYLIALLLWRHMHCVCIFPRSAVYRISNRSRHLSAVYAHCHARARESPQKGQQPRYSVVSGRRERATLMSWCYSNELRQMWAGIKCFSGSWLCVVLPVCQSVCANPFSRACQWKMQLCNLFEIVKVMESGGDVTRPLVIARCAGRPQH
jgi:hypothetical protein